MSGGGTMSTNASKDFDGIADDYMFFERHASEAYEDARAYLGELAEVSAASGAIRMLDFGCGSGAFTARLLELAGWPRDRVHLALVDPAETVRGQAAARLAPFTAAPIVESRGVPADSGEGFDVVLSNHALYYVSDLEPTLSRLIEALAPRGLRLGAIAARTNALIAFWIAGFELLGREVPYNTSEDVESALQAMGVAYQKHTVAYQLTFPDTTENRMRIIRFLLADHLAHMPLAPLLQMFDRHARAGRIEIHTDSDHFTLRACRGSSPGPGAAHGA